MTLCGRICSAFKRGSHRKNRVHAHPLGQEEGECHGNRGCPNPNEKEEMQKEELDENESQICFYNLKNLREGNNSPSVVQESMDNLCALAKTKMAGVLRAICKYRQSIHKISPKHRLRINQILQMVIGSASSIDYTLANVIIRLAAEDMLRTTDLQDIYQDVAGDILVPLWNHFPAEVLTKLLEGFQGRLLPYRSILCVLGKLANKVFSESDSFKTEIWERKLVEFVERLLIDVTDKACLGVISSELLKGVGGGCHRPSPEKVFLYQYYGAILRASDDSQLVQEHLYAALAMSHLGPLEAKGIASAFGLAASRHPDEVFNVLGSYSENVSYKETFMENTSQYCRWSCLLLCYGRVAISIKEEVLPRVELIVSRMIELFAINPSDMNVKKSFLIAVLMLLEAISGAGKMQDVRLHMKPLLVDCLIVLIEREPTHALDNTVRQDAMYIVKELSKLKPSLEAEKKSGLLRASFQRVFGLASLPILEGLLSREDAQAAQGVKGHYYQTMKSLEEMLQALLLENPCPRELQQMMELMEPWLTSALDHERERAVETAMKLLKFVAVHFFHDMSQEFSRLAHLTAILICLCNDSVRHISCCAVQGVSCLYEVLLHRKEVKNNRQKKPKWFGRRSLKPEEDDDDEEETLSLLVPGDSHWHLAMHHNDLLFSAQLTNLMLSALGNIRESDPDLLRASEEVLNAIAENHAVKIKRVKDIVSAIYACLQLCQSSYWNRKVVLRALRFMFPSHMEEVLRSCLTFSIPINRHANELWTAMASDAQEATSVLQLLLKNLQAKDPLEGDEDCAATLSLAAMNVIHETFRIPGYRMALVEMHLQLFIPLLKQVLYVMQLDLPEGLKSRQEGHPGALSFQSTSVEIIKHLFSVAGDWVVYACIEFQQGWRLLSTPEQFLEGTRLLARAMTECDSPEIPGLFGEAALILNSEEDELKKMTALALVIEFLKSPSVAKLMNRFSLKEHLEEGLMASNPAIKDLCVKGLGSFVFQQEKVKLLRDQLPALMESIFSGQEGDVITGLGTIMATVYEMDGQGIGSLCVDLALNVRSFFEDERATVRANAFSLFGQLVVRAREADKALLKKEVVYSLLPVLLHWKDQDNTVAMGCKLTFLHCGLFLGWPHMKLLFRSMAWEDLRSSLVNAWKYLMRNNHENIHIFISQALEYLRHPQVGLRHSAARFTGHTLNYYSSELSKNLDQADAAHLHEAFRQMESSPDRAMVRFARTYRGVLQKLSVKRRWPGAGEKEGPEPESSPAAGKQSSEWGSRAPSPLLLPRPESPLPAGPLGMGSAGLQSPRWTRQPFSQRGKMSKETEDQDQWLSVEPRVSSSRRHTSEGRKTGYPLSHGDN